MAILDLFSNRQKRGRNEVPDVFVYDRLPQALRVQTFYIVHDALGVATRRDYSTPALEIYQRITEMLCRHFGRLKLAEGIMPDEVLGDFLLREPDIASWLDGIELACRFIERFGSDSMYRSAVEASLEPTEAIADLNQRFLQHGVGYQYASGTIIRVDSQFLHAEITKPTLALLHDACYAGANDEFLKAHEHYRQREVKDCLVYCLKALESTMKIICAKRAWHFKPTDQARALIAICFDNGLIPTFLRSHYSALQSVLESGIPTVRNKLGGHGQGAQVVEVPPHYAAYALHMTGSAIQFLIESEKSLP